jgi:hypothetical protein
MTELILFLPFFQSVSRVNTANTVIMNAPLVWHALAKLEKYIKFWSEILREKKNLRKLHVDWAGRGGCSETGCKGVDWTELAASDGRRM